MPKDYDLTHVARAKRASKVLKKLLSLFMPDIKLSLCQQITAQMMGFRDWHHMAASPHLMAPYDEDLDGSGLERRRTKQQSVLLNRLPELLPYPGSDFLLWVAESTCPMSTKPWKTTPELLDECRENGWEPVVDR